MIIRLTTKTLIGSLRPLFTNGKRPYWPDSALKDHVKPAAIEAGITKRVTWHTFRHSLASLLGQQGEEVKTVQELLRHATSRITLDITSKAAPRPSDWH